MKLKSKAFVHFFSHRTKSAQIQISVTLPWHSTVYVESLQTALHVMLQVERVSIIQFNAEFYDEQQHIIQL